MVVVDHDGQEDGLGVEVVAHLITESTSTRIDNVIYTRFFFPT